jgi:hypothetical protein
MSTIPEIVPFSETIGQTAQEGLGAGGQVIAKWEMPEIGHSVETSQPGQEGLRLGQDVRMSTMPEVGQSDVETSQPVTPTSIDKLTALQSLDFSKGLELKKLLTYIDKLDFSKCLELKKLPTSIDKLIAF